MKEPDTLIIGGHFDGQLTNMTDGRIRLYYTMEKPKITRQSEPSETVYHHSELYRLQEFKGQDKYFKFYAKIGVSGDEIVQMLLNRYKEARE